MAAVKRIMEMRLNMVELKCNYRGKYQDTICSACKKEEETTEHVIMCGEYKRLTGHQIEEVKMDDIKWQNEASLAYEKIQQTREWLIEKPRKKQNKNKKQ